jgi:predicted metal-binding protein
MTVAKKINYDIRNIHDCIVQASEDYQKISKAEKKKLYREGLDRVQKNPDLKEILSMDHIHGYDVKGVKNFARIGILPPELIVIDERIRDMCLNQFWMGNPITRVNDFARCPAYGNRPCCPPFSPSSRKTKKLLDRSDVFVMLQTKLIGNEALPVQTEGPKSEASPDPYWNWQYGTMLKLEEDLKSALGKSRVLAKYGAGPCVICGVTGCTMDETCKQPDKKFCAVESVGMAAGQMCTDMAYLSGDKRWEINWIKRWTLPTQTPEKFKFVFGLALKVPN